MTVRKTCVVVYRTGYTRVIVEKPFGKDSESFRQLSTDLYQHLTEDQMFRIDHYLGKELIENLTVRTLLLKALAVDKSLATALAAACQCAQSSLHQHCAGLSHASQRVL